MKYECVSQCCSAQMIPDTGECNETPIGICSQCQDWAGFVYVDEEGEELPYGTMPVECAAGGAPCPNTCAQEGLCMALEDAKEFNV